MNEFLKLIIIIVAPLTLVLFTTVMLYKHRHEDRKSWGFIKFNSTFDAKHGLASQPIFWMTIIYPIGLFFSTGFWTWYGYRLNISANGFIKFIEISALPIGLLGLSIPLSVLTARLHGTKQTALQISKAQRQIDEAQQKNKTDLYLAHYNHFCDHIKEIEPLWKKKKFDVWCYESSTITIDKKMCYQILYPTSSLTAGVGNIDQSCFNEFLYKTEGILNNAIAITKSKKKSEKLYRDFFVTSSTELYNFFEESFFNESLNNIITQRGEFPLSGEEVCFATSFIEMFNVLNFINKLMTDIFLFDIEISRSLERRKNAAFNLIKDLSLDKESTSILGYLQRQYHPLEKNDWSKLQP